MASLPTWFCALFLTASLAAQETTEQRLLPAAPGWNAAEIYHGEAGTWYVRVANVQSDYGAPEAIVTDDDGRFIVLSVYSGKWTSRHVVPDRGWLAPSTPADVDPRVAGNEMYAAGRLGNLHRIEVKSERYGGWKLESAEIGHVAKEEFHSVLAAELDSASPNAELLAFAISGAVYQLRPRLRDGDPGASGFLLNRVAMVEGRVRDVVVIPGEGGGSPWIAGTSRSGHLIGMRLTAKGLEHQVLAEESMGMGRVAYRAAGAQGREAALYVTRDDGVVLRFSRVPTAAGEGSTAGHGAASAAAQVSGPFGAWRREVVFAGAQGLRGIVAGQFHSDPTRESIMVYGYGKKVQVVSRRPGAPWEVETVFSGEHRGHWLAVGEFDGRNNTDEVIATGFGGQAILLSRPPGYGLGKGVGVDRELEEVKAAKDGSAPDAAQSGSAERPWRIGVRASAVALQELSPLNYQGGFETKTMLYETLVRRGADGRIVPGLASDWQLAADGKAFTFNLRPGATFHDGEPVTAAAVAVHFRRWVGLPEHAWLGCNARITSVEVLGPKRLRVRLDRSYALLADLCVLNPAAIRGPGALDREGAYRRPVGTGPFAFVGVREQGNVLRYRRHGSSGQGDCVDLVRLDGATADPVDALLRGDVDAVLGTWLTPLRGERVAGLRRDPRFQVLDGPGSSMTYLRFRLDRGPTADAGLRARVASAIDRAELVRVVELGMADPSTGWAAPSVKIWPQGKPRRPLPPAAEGAGSVVGRPLRILLEQDEDRRLAETVCGQLRRAGIPAEVSSRRDPRVEEEAANPASLDWDLRIGVTHGSPYDPFTTAATAFVPGKSSAASARSGGCDPKVTALMRKAMATADDETRYQVYGEIQDRLDEVTMLIPLYAPRRIAVLRRGMPVPELDHDMYALDARWLTDRKD